MPTSNISNLKHSELFSSLSIGDLTVPNRIVVAPVTRSRSTLSGLQTPLHALYYAQRASAGFIVTEATQISAEAQGSVHTPCIYTDEQIESWALVTDAVHNAGGRIFCQLLHSGAISHEVFQPDGGKPVSSSPFKPEGKAHVGELIPDEVVYHPKARELKLDEIPRIIEDYRHAARCAKQAGFDGIELHGANGYLLDQFLRSSVNKRNDAYGGSVENRIRLLVEVVDALREIYPAGHIGVRLSPTGGLGGSWDKDPETLYTSAAKAIAGKGLAYLHVIRPSSRPDEGKGLEPGEGDTVVAKMREAFDGVFVVNGGFDPSEAARWIAENRANAIAFGRLFIANPDLPQRIAADGPYNEPDSETFYGGGAEGYVDYPTLNRTEVNL